MPKIALYGTNNDELETAKVGILTMAQALRKIDVFCDFDALQKAFFTLDMLLVENNLFYHVLPQIQSIMDRIDPQKTIGQKIIVTNFTMPITQKQIDTWLDSLGACGNIKISVVGGYRAERVQDILYFENRARSVYVKTNADFFKSALSMKEATELTAHESFAAPYVSFLVNLRWVKAIKGRDVLLKNGETIPLSQKKSSAFRKHYHEIMSKM